jgi:hypothetical protein
MPGDERSQILAWHEEAQGKSFHNKEELLAYCMDNVNVLRQACCTFGKFFEISQDGPLSAGYYSIFHLQFLKPESVCIIPRGGTVWETGSLLRLFNGWRNS